MIGIPPKHVYYAMLFGLPSMHYPRTVQRDDDAIVRRAKIKGPSDAVMFT